MYKHVLVCMKNYNIQMHIERFSNIFFNECNILVYLKNKFTSSYLNVAKIYRD